MISKFQYPTLLNLLSVYLFITYVQFPSFLLFTKDSRSDAAPIKNPSQQVYLSGLSRVFQNNAPIRPIALALHALFPSKHSMHCFIPVLSHYYPSHLPIHPRKLCLQTQFSISLFISSIVNSQSDSTFPVNQAATMLYIPKVAWLICKWTHLLSTQV